MEQKFNIAENLEIYGAYLTTVDEAKNHFITRIFQICYENKYINQNNENEEIYKESKYFVTPSDFKKSEKDINDQLMNLSYENLKKLTSIIISKENHSKIISRLLVTQTKELNDLIYDLLKLNKEDDSIYDFGFGQGNFLFSLLNRSISEEIKIKSISGCEINYAFYFLAKMVFAIFDFKDLNVNLTNCDGMEADKMEFNKAFIFPSFGTFSDFDEYKTKLDENIVLTRKNTSQWAYIDNMINSSKEFERMVSILSPRSLYNIADDKYKRALIKNGLIEGIIELPNNLFDMTTLKSYIVVFSKNNKEVKFLNASNMCKSLDKRGTKVELNNKQIYEEYNSENVIKVSNEELLKREELNLTRSSEVQLNFKNSTRLSSVAEVFTGSQYTFSYFEEYLCNNPKDCKYKLIASNDISEYSVDWKNLRMVDIDDEKLDKFVVQKNDVIITSKSSKVKIAVVDFDPQVKCLVTGGMLIVRPDASKLNPFYLKVFLESSIGTEILKSIQKGGSYITSISCSNLANININLIDVNKQNMVADKFKKNLSSLLAYKKQLDDIQTTLKNLYQDEVED